MFKGIIIGLVIALIGGKIYNAIHTINLFVLKIKVKSKILWADFFEQTQKKRAFQGCGIRLRPNACV